MVILNVKFFQIQTYLPLSLPFGFSSFATLELGYFKLIAISN